MKDSGQSTGKKIHQLFLPVSFALLVVVGAVVLGRAGSLSSEKKRPAVFATSSFV